VMLSDRAVKEEEQNLTIFIFRSAAFLFYINKKSRTDSNFIFNLSGSFPRRFLSL
jgi:hypothetical protein